GQLYLLSGDLVPHLLTKVTPKKKCKDSGFLISPLKKDPAAKTPVVALLLVFSAFHNKYFAHISANRLSEGPDKDR
ncbi:hypothetical protein STEG23_035707, partial [Scotinomys teguina]